MPDRFSDRSPDRPSDEELRADAAFDAGRNASGIGAAIARSDYSDGEHVWECIVSDGKEWHFIRVLGADLGRYPDLASEDIKQGIERFAATLTDSYRLQAVVNASPLHVDRSGTVSN